MRKVTEFKKSVEVFKCSHTSIKKISELLLLQNPKNSNLHSHAQIERLARIIEFQGQRSPIVISNRSGFITKGHCRLLAMQLLRWETVAVDFQDYADEDQEYADMTADNAIATWAILDNNKFLGDIKTFDLSKIDLLGFVDIPELKFPDYSEKNKELDADTFGEDLDQTCPKCGFAFDGV